MWKPIQDAIFINQEDILPKMMFQDSYDLMPIGAGAIFDEEDYLMLQKCLQVMGEHEFVVIQNTFGQQKQELLRPPFRMKYPVSTSWEELNSGSYISKVLFNFFYEVYFVYSATKRWAKYVDNDYSYPLDIVAFLPEYSELFFTNFKSLMDDEHKSAVLRALEAMPAYRQYDKHLR